MNFRINVFNGSEFDTMLPQERVDALSFNNIPSTSTGKYIQLNSDNANDAILEVNDRASYRGKVWFEIPDVRCKDYCVTDKYLCVYDGENLSVFDLSTMSLLTSVPFTYTLIGMISHKGEIVISYERNSQIKLSKYDVSQGALVDIVTSTTLPTKKTPSNISAGIISNGTCIYTWVSFIKTDETPYSRLLCYDYDVLYKEYLKYEFNRTGSVFTDAIEIGAGEILFAVVSNSLIDIYSVIDGYGGHIFNKITESPISSTNLKFGACKYGVVTYMLANGDIYSAKLTTGTHIGRWTFSPIGVIDKQTWYNKFSKVMIDGWWYTSTKEELFRSSQITVTKSMYSDYPNLHKITKGGDRYFAMSQSDTLDELNKIYYTI